MTPPSRKGRLALSVSALLGLLSLLGAAGAFFVDGRETMMVLAVSACVAFGGLVAAFVSLRGEKLGPSLAAILGSVAVLMAVALSFGGVSFGRLMDAVEEGQSSDDAAAPVVDEDFAFRLEPPTPIATMYDASTAHELNERARAGFWIPERDVSGMVFVEIGHGESLEAMAVSELHFTFDEESAWPLETVPVRFADRFWAVRVRRRVERDGRTWFSESTFFERDGWLHHLFASGPDEPGDRYQTDPWYPAALEAFVPTEGSIEHRWEPRRAVDAEGPGWRVRDNAYQDAAWGWSIAGQDRFELEWGAASLDRVDDWVVTLRQRRPDAWVSLQPVRCVDRDAAIARSHEIYAGDGRTRREAPPLELEVLGQAATFEAWTWEASWTQYARRAVVPTEACALTVAAWSPSEEVTDEAVRAAVAGLRALSADTRASIAFDLPYAEVEPTWWARGDAVRFLGRGFGWRRPSGEWRPLPPAAGAPDGETMYWVRAPRLGLTLALDPWPFPADSPSELIRLEVNAVEGALRQEIETPSPGLAIGGVIGEQRGLATAIAASEVDGGYVLLTVVGEPSALAAHPDEVRAALMGAFASGPTEAGWDDAGAWRDPPMGFVYAAPWGADGFQTEWRELDGRVGRLLEGERDGTTLAVIATPLHPYETPAETQTRLLNRLYPSVRVDDPRFSEREATVAGQPAVRRARYRAITGERTTVVRVVRGGVVLIVFIDSYDDAVDPDELVEGLSFL